MTKTFMMLLVAFVVLGASLGGAFVGGVALGKSQGDDSAAGSSGPLPASSLRQQASDQPGQGRTDQFSQGLQGGDPSPEDLSQLRQRFQSGEIAPEDLSQLRQRFQSGEITPEDLSQLRQRFQSGEIAPEDLSQLREQSQSGEANPEEQSQFRPRFGQGSGGQGGLTGTINMVDGDTVTVDTPQGVLQATIDDETVIQKIAVGEPEDLQEGVRVTVIGQSGEDGPVDASLILITPEGASGLFDGGFFSGQRPQRDRTAGDGGGASGGDGFRPN